MKWMAMLLALILCFGAATAQEAYPILQGEDARAIVEGLFAAATGATMKAETAIRADMTEEELSLRNAENAEYRAKTLPWLMAALQPMEAATAEAAEALTETATNSANITEAAEATESLNGTTAVPAAATEVIPATEATPVMETEAALATEAVSETEALPVMEADPAAQAETADGEIPAWTIADSYAAFLENELGRAYLEQMEALGGADMEGCLQLTRQACAVWMAEVDHAMLAEMNADYACWLYAPGTQIDYPVVQCGDNSHYLHRMFNGERNSAGTLFIDYRNLPDFQDPNTLIYGHHMRNDSMFGTLTDYADQAYFESHPYMLLMREGEICLLEIFAGYTTTDEDHCYDIAISDAEDMLEFVRMAQEKSDFEADIEILPGNRLATLSTCAYAFKDARYIAIGRLLTVWQAEGGDTLDR